tara:strand:+ start:131 stop:397 length:267 start_codon:yes stop_codon:yes gene_type:complete
MSDVVEMTPEEEKFVINFTDKLHEFICNSENDELGYDYPTLIQEVVGFSVYYAYMHVENPDQVTFALGKIKQLAIKERKKANEEVEIH